MSQNQLVADTACPECRQGKHPNCDGSSWDVATDGPAACPCWVEGHGNVEPPPALLERLVEVKADVHMRRDTRTPEQVMADLAADRYEAGLERSEW